MWFGALAWSGNWRISVEQTPYRQVRVTGGMNSFDFAYRLQPSESLETPRFFAGFSTAGFGGASRTFHRFIAPTSCRPVFPAACVRCCTTPGKRLTFHVDEAGQKALAEKAAKLGVELFVMDDGWFGKRNDDHAGLGDWVVNPQKFPHGLKPLIDAVNRLHMDFGLWVEPEMINADSDLYRAHPDWVINFAGRPRSELRNQMILNLARNDVKEYIFGVLDKLATENNIRYFKWDMNRISRNPDGRQRSRPTSRSCGSQYVRNLYEIIDRLRASIRGSKSNRAPAAADGSIWEFCSVSTKSGPRTIPRHSTGCGFRKAFRRSIRRRSCRPGSRTFPT